MDFPVPDGHDGHAWRFHGRGHHDDALWRGTAKGHQGRAFRRRFDEFSGELKGQFGLPEFPLMYSTSLLCRLRYGWSFEEASAIGQVGKCKYPMLFIHGDENTFVATKMVYRLYEAKTSDKGLWITEGVQHAVSYMKHREEYIQRVRNFVSHSANDGLNH